MEIREIRDFFVIFSSLNFASSVLHIDNNYRMYNIDLAVIHVNMLFLTLYLISSNINLIILGSYIYIATIKLYINICIYMYKYVYIYVCIYI